MKYESVIRIASKLIPGVTFVISRLSFARRLELTKLIRELAQQLEYLDAGNTITEKLDAAVVASEIDKLYLQWGLQDIEGLEVDGSPATPELLGAKGPEALVREALEAVKAECGLSDAEKKT